MHKYVTINEKIKSFKKNIEVDSDKDSQSETSGGYAQEMGDDYKLRQQKILGEVIKAQDICITTAQIPGRKAPVLITEKMVNSMRDGSVIVDLSVETGGNCALSAPDKVIDVGGVKIIGHSNWPSLIPAATSSLYGKNLMHFLNLLIDKQSKKLSIDWEDEIIRGALLTRDGAQVNSLLDSMEL